MVLRRLILSLMLAALGICAVGGIVVPFLSTPDGFAPVIIAGIAVGVATGLLLPLTLLVDRPRFRSAGIAGMITVVVLLLGVLGLCVLDFIPYSYRSSLGALDDAISSTVLMMGAITGIPTAILLLLAQFRWARIAPKLLAVAAVVAFAIGLIAFLYIGSSAFFETEGYTLAAATSTYGFGALAAILLVNVSCGDRRLFRFPMLLSLLVAWVLAMIDIYTQWGMSRTLVHLIVGLYVIPIFFAHLNLLLMIPRKSRRRWLLIATMTLSGVCGILAVLNDVLETDFYFGVATACGIAAGCGSLAMVVRALAHRRFDFRAASDRTLLTQLQLVCPRCNKAQTVLLGNSQCAQCGLQFSISATEPQCMECGYLLYGISAARCPECGAPNPAAAAGILPPAAA